MYYISDYPDDNLTDRDPQDIPNLCDALKEACDQFGINPDSDDLERDKKILIFSETSVPQTDPDTRNNV